MSETSDQQKTKDSDTTAVGKQLLLELQKIREELAILNSHNLFGLHSLMPKALAMQFLKGTAFGLGSLVGATIVLSALLYFLSQMEVIPLLGDWIKQLNATIQRP